MDEENADAIAPALAIAPVSTALPIPSLKNPVPSPENVQALATTQIHHCDKCSYSSSFKGNMVC